MTRLFGSGHHKVDKFVFLVDDGSTDGTGDMVRKEFPEVNVLQGDGTLFWNNGMRLAWSEAFKHDTDYFLWLNDDTFLDPDALSRLLATAEELEQKNGKGAIVCGSTRDPATGDTTYGGRLFHGFWKRPAFSLVDPSDVPLPCDTINGNCVLIPADVARDVGNLSPEFKHDLGDYDYGLRARQQGYECWIAPGYVGTCAGHELRGSHFDADMPIADRLEKMRKPSGLPPVRDWMIFTRRHGGFFWPVFWARSSLRALLPWLWLQFRGKSFNRKDS